MMNEDLDKFARDWLKEKLALCTEYNHFLFKSMYANGKMSLDINTVVDKMEQEKLSWAMEQVKRTINIDNISK